MRFEPTKVAKKMQQQSLLNETDYASSNGKQTIQLITACMKPEEQSALAAGLSGIGETIAQVTSALCESGSMVGRAVRLSVNVCTWGRQRRIGGIKEDRWPHDDETSSGYSRSEWHTSCHDNRFRGPSAKFSIMRLPLNQTRNHGGDYERKS